MKNVILSIAVCTFWAGPASSDGGNIYGSSPVQYSHPQPINYHYPQSHYGSQQSYSDPAGYHSAQQRQHHGANQFSDQYLVTAIKTDPAPAVVHYQPPSYKSDPPFNGQSYIIEPSYVLKPFRPETTYHAQAYRPHNPAPAVYQPAYHGPGYPSYQAPSYPAPVYHPPAYQPQAYPAPAYQNPAQSPAFLVYSTPLLAAYTTQTATTPGPVTSLQPSATRTYVTTASVAAESVSSSPVQPVKIVESTASDPVLWSDILSSDANELGQKYAAENGDQDTGKGSSENVELESTTGESIPKSYQAETAKKDEEPNSLHRLNPPSYPIPANHTSKTVWKIPRHGDVGGKGGNQANKKSTVDSNERSEIDEGSKSGLTDRANKDGTHNPESSEMTNVDQVSQISLQGKRTKYEGRTAQTEALSANREETPEDQVKAAVVELVGQFQSEKSRSGSSVYYEQGPRVTQQDVNEAKRNGESKESDHDRPVAELNERGNEHDGEIDSDEAGTEATPLVGTNEGNAEQPDTSIRVKETAEQKEVWQSIYAQGLVQRQEDKVDDSNETTEVSISKAASETYPPLVHPQNAVVKTELMNSAAIALPDDKDESDEVPNGVDPGITIQPAVSAHEILFYPPRPAVRKPTQAMQESEEVEPPAAGFGDKIKVFTKFATAIQKVTEQHSNEADRLADTPQPDSISADNYRTKVADPHVNTQPATEYTYATEGPTFHASLFYRKPVLPTNDPLASDLTTPTTTVALLEEEEEGEEELRTEVPYNSKPLFYAQAAEKLAASQLARTSADQSRTGQDRPLKKVYPVKEDDVPSRSTEPNHSVRIVAETISRDQPVQVVNAEPVVQMPVLADDPMEKTDFYATQRIYTASAESPGEEVTTSSPTIDVPDQNPDVTSTYAYIEEAGISAEYQKEIAAAQREALSLSNAYRSFDETQSQTDIVDLSQADVSFPSVVAVLNNASGDDLTQAQSAEDVSSEVTSRPVTEFAYAGRTESREVDTVTSTAKPAEEASSEIAFAAVTQSASQANTNYEDQLITTTTAQSAEDASFEVDDPPVTESDYQEKTKIPSYEAPVVTTDQWQSAEDVSLEIIAPVTDFNDQEEASNVNETPWTRYRIPVVNQLPVEAVTAPYDATELFTTPDVDTTSFVVGTLLQVDSEESQEAVLSSNQTDDPPTSKTSSPVQNITSVAPLPPCHADKSSDVVHSPRLLFNTAALANVPLDSRESSDEDIVTVTPTADTVEVTTPSVSSNESAERTTVATGGYKYIFKSRPTPNRFYEAKTTTAQPSSDATSPSPTTSRRPLVVIGKPVGIRKPINGRVYSRPSSVSQRRPQTLAQIKILPTRLRSSSSTIHLPNRRFFIGRSLMASEKSNRESSKEDDDRKAK